MLQLWYFMIKLLTIKLYIIAEVIYILSDSNFMELELIYPNKWEFQHFFCSFCYIQTWM